MTLIGKNRYLIDQRLAEQKDRFAADNGSMAIEQFDVADMAVDQVLVNLSGQSLFNASRLIIMKGLSQNAHSADMFDQFIDQANDTLEVLIVEPDMDRRTRLYAQLKSKTELQLCDDLDDNSLIAWLIREAGVRQTVLSRDSAKYLVDKVGSDQLRLSNELAKLSLYSREIDRQAIDLLVVPSTHSTTFDLLDATFAGDRRKVNRIYAEQRALGTEPQLIMGLVVWQLYLLACLKTAGNIAPEQVSQDTGIAVFAIRKSRQIANRLSLVELKEAIARLSRIDYLVKQSSVSLDDALLNYLISF